VKKTGTSGGFSVVSKTGRIVKTFLVTLVIILLIVTLLLAIFIVVGIVLSDDRQMSPWGTGFFIISTGSMEPSIPVGSVIFVREVAADKIAVNDIITYLSENRQDIVTHRVMAISEGDGRYVFTTRGDANNTDDSPLAFDRVIGRVVYYISGNSFLIGVFNDAKTIGIGIVILGAALCIYAIVSSGLRKKKIQRNVD